MEGKVYELDLHGKGLKVLPAELKKLKSLRVLDASCNKITRLQGLSENKELRELKVYSNHISVLDGLERLKDLSTLLLQYNEVSTIGPGLKQCCKLHVLRLDHNLLGCVKAGELAACSASLTHLDLSFNQLDGVEGLGSMTSLAELNLESNGLKEVPTLSHCKKLIELNLSGNPLLTYQLSNLKALLQLKTLKLGSIALSSLSLLPRFPQLQDLHVPHNTISSVDACSSLFPSLELLDLQGNQLDTVPVLATLTPLEGLAELLVEGNPLCSSVDNYRADTTQLLPRLEVLDGVSLRANTAAMESANVMRPLTPAAAGPSVRQVERQLVEAEAQLLNSCSEIAARFRELQDQAQASSTEAMPLQVQEQGRTEISASSPGSTPHSQGRDRYSADDPRVGAAGDVPISSLNHSTKRPSTRTRLQEALTYANQSMPTT